MKTFRLISLLLPLLLPFYLPTIAYADEGICTEADRCLDEAVQAYKDGKAEEALQIFSYISKEFDDPRVAGISSFMVGHIMDQLMVDGADPYLEKAYSSYPLIGDFALFKLAGMFENRKEHEGAAGLYKKIYGSYPDSPLKKKALLHAADSYLAAGKIEEAIDTYEAFIAIYPRDKSVPSALYGVGMSYLQGEKISPALDYFKRIWVHYPESPVSWPAKEKINSLRGQGYEISPFTPADTYIRAEGLYEAGLYSDALAEYQRFLSLAGDVPDKKKKEARYKIGMCHYNLRRLTDAEDALESFLYNYPSHLRASEALYWLSRTYLREGKEDAFIKASKGFLRRHQANDRVPEILYRLGIIYAGKRDVDKAISYYERVLKEHPDSGYSTDSQWAKGWLLYKERMYKRALRVFNSLLQWQKDSTYIPKLLYWKARASEMINDREGMEKSLCQLCSRYAGSFYCLFARNYYSLNCPSSIGMVAMDIPDETFADYRPGLSPGISGDDQDMRIKLFYYLGLKEEAMEEIQWLSHRIKNNRDRAVTIASILYAMEEYDMALGILYTNFSRDELYSGRESDMRIWKLMYPTGFSSLISRYAGENDVDPRLVFALIREESWFNKKAVSPAGAIGLMQMMPETASSVLKVSDIERDSLFDPEINISLGTRFFSDLLRDYDENILLALAGYNAGPVVVSRWLKERDGYALDEFIEDIPYKETREYVKRVFRSYMEYRRMTESPSIISPHPFVIDRGDEGEGGG